MKLPLLHAPWLLLSAIEITGNILVAMVFAVELGRYLEAMVFAVELGRY